MGLLGGLLLLGLNLALVRRDDGGVLWGAVGLHGGLVGAGSPCRRACWSCCRAPPWLAGPGGSQPNPIGGLVGWIGLGGLLVLRSYLKQRCRENGIADTNG